MVGAYLGKQNNNRKNKLKKPFVFLLLTVMFFIPLAGLTGAFENPAAIGPTSAERYLVSLINDARANPLETARSLGLDPATILTQHPDRQDIFLNGLAALRSNGNLYLAAKAKCLEILANNLVDNQPGAVNQKIDQRIRERGFIPAVTAGYAASLVFTNYIAPEKAARILFEQMFKAELNSNDFKILNPDLTDLGISIKSGSVNISGKHQRVYNVAAYFAKPAFSPDELVLLELVNQARQNPAASARMAGLDPNAIIEDFPGLKEIFENGLAPVNMNEKLFAAAAAHAADMLANNYYDSLALDGKTADDRIREQGYEPDQSGEVWPREIMGTITSGVFMDIAPADIARMLFEANLKQEFSAAEADRRILASSLREAGISFKVEAVNNGAGFYDTRYLLVADFGSGENEKNSYLTGAVFKDTDSNGLYNSGEGMEGVLINIKGAENKLDLFTGPAGGFGLALEPGTYQITAHLPDETVETEVVLAEENIGVWFVVKSELQ